MSVLTNLKKMTDNFYKDNEDLKPFKKVVAAVFEEIAAENPDKSYEENLKVVGTEVRKRLDLQKAAKKKAAPKKASPRLPGQKGNQRGRQKPRTDGLESEIDAMNQSLQT